MNPKAAADATMAEDGSEEPRARSLLQSSKLLQMIYDRLFVAAHFLTAGIANLFPRRPRSISPPRRPIVALRIVSVIDHGGVAKVAGQTLLRMSADRVRTRVLLFEKQPRPEGPLAANPGLEITRERLTLYPAAYRWRIFGDVIRLARLIRTVKPDVIHLHEPQFAAAVSMAAALSGRPPIAVHLHSVYAGRRRFISAPLVRLERRALRPLQLIACSQTILDGAKEWIRDLKRPIALIPDGADDFPLLSAAPNLAEGILNAAKGRIILAKVARIHPLKRIGDFLAACRILIDEGYPIFVLLASYGKTEDEARLRRRFDRMFTPDDAVFLHQTPGVQSLLSLVKIGVSASSLEGLGLNVLEFQTAGACVVATDLPAHREMIRDGQTGLLFEPADVAGLLRALKRLLSDESLRARLAEAGRAEALARKWEDSAASTLALYQQMIGDAPSPK